MQNVVLSINSVTQGCCWLCWTCMHRSSCGCSFVLCPPKVRQRHWALLPYLCLAADIKGIASCFTTTQHLKPDAGLQPLTCSACLTGCMMVPRLQKWQSSCTRLDTIILTQSKTCGPLGCLLFATKLYKSGKYTDWQEQVITEAA